MDKRKITLTVIAVAILLVVLVGSTYAYWTANTENKISTNTTIQTGVLKLVLDDGTNKDGVLTGTIDPNNTKFTTYLSITNEGTYDTFARLYFKGLTNTFSSDLVYSIEEVDSLPNNGSTPKIVKRIKYQVPVPSAETSSRELLADGLLIKMGTLNGNNLTPNTQYYRVTVEYLWSDTVDQTDDLGKSFYAGFDIEQGDKVTENIVMIDNIEQLVELANEVNSGDSKSGKEYRLMRNLDFNDNDSYRDATQTTYGDINKNGTIEPIKTELTTSAGWNPIGNDTNPYSGVFNGNNNEIKNLYINNSDVSLTNIGLFGHVTNGTIENLGIRDENISSSVTATIGGIVSLFSNSIMNNCYNTVTTKNDNVYNINLNLKTNYIGGLVGLVKTNIISITNSYNNTNINGAYSAGGIIGGLVEISKINMVNINNSGNVKSKQHAGGIFGITDTSGYVYLENTSNSGNITVLNETSGSDIYIGGIFGFIINNSIINRASNTGTLQVNGVSAWLITSGGLGGTYNENKKNIIINSYNSGNLVMNASSSNSYYGGLMGRILSSTTFIINSYNNGNINAYENSSGITYNYNSYSNSTINNVYAMGSFNATNMYGIINNYGTKNVTNSYYINTISNNNIGITMSLADMASSSFVTTLNNNRSSITLPSELNGYTLSTWCTSDNGPVLDYQVPESERSTRCPAYNN